MEQWDSSAEVCLFFEVAGLKIAHLFFEVAGLKIAHHVGE
jgi:hypothetical protein